MIKTLLKYRNLGTPNFFTFLISEMNRRGLDYGFRRKELQQLTFNKIIDNRSVYDGCIPLALEIGLLYNKDNLLFLNHSLVNTNLKGSVSYMIIQHLFKDCLLYTSPSPRDRSLSRMPSSA